MRIQLIFVSHTHINNEDKVVFIITRHALISAHPNYKKQTKINCGQNDRYGTSTQQNQQQANTLNSEDNKMLVRQKWLFRKDRVPVLTLTFKHTKTNYLAHCALSMIIRKFELKRVTKGHKIQVHVFIPFTRNYFNLLFVILSHTMTCALYTINC